MSFDLPFELTSIIVIGLASVAMACLFFFAMVANRLRRLVLRARGHVVKRTGVLQNGLRFLLVIIWVLASVAVLFMAAFAQSFKTFNKKELVAEVTSQPIGEEPGSMLLTLTQIADERKQPPEAFIVNGDQWALEGDVVKWDEWLNFAGLHTMFKLTRVRGRFEKTADELSNAASVYSLVAREERPEWRWLYKNGYRMRFVDAVYGSTVFTYPDPAKTFLVYVTTSGFAVAVKEP